MKLVSSSPTINKEASDPIPRIVSAFLSFTHIGNKLCSEWLWYWYPSSVNGDISEYLFLEVILKSASLVFSCMLALPKLVIVIFSFFKIKWKRGTADWFSRAKFAHGFSSLLGWNHRVDATFLLAVLVFSWKWVNCILLTTALNLSVFHPTKKGFLQKCPYSSWWKRQFACIP